MPTKKPSSGPAGGSMNKKDAKLWTEYLKQQVDGKEKLISLDNEVNDALSKAARLQKELLSGENDLIAAIAKRNQIGAKYNDLQLELQMAQEDLAKNDSKHNSNIVKRLEEKVKKNKELLSQSNELVDKTKEMVDQGKEALKNQKKNVEVSKQHAKAMEKAASAAYDLVDRYDEMIEPFEEVDEFVKKLPGGGLISKALGLDKLGEKIKKQLIDQLAAGQVAGKGMVASLGPLLPLLIAAGLLYKAFEFDKELTQFAKDMDVSKEGAKGLSIEADHIATSLGMAGITGKEVGATMVALREEFGSIDKATNEGLVKSVTLLRERMGLTNEEALSLNSTATLLGTNLDELSASSMAMSDGLIGGKQMLKEMAKLPPKLVAGFKGTTKELQKAVVKGKLFGLELSKVSEIGDGLLDIESSLEKEMTANVLTGKHMNLNAARQYALQGDVSSLQQELLNQAGGLAEYQKMAPYQQKAMAEAMGMTADEMTTMLTKAQELKDVGLDQAKVEEILTANAETQDALMSDMDAKQKGYLNKLIEQRKQEEATAKFQAAMARMMEALSKVLLPVVEGFGMILGFVGDIVDYITMGVEKLNHWMGPAKEAADGMQETEGWMSKILKIAAAIGITMLAWKPGKKLISGAKSMLGFGGGSKTEDVGGGETGDQVKGATQGKNKVSQILDGVKNIVDSIKGVVQSAISFVKDVGKDLLSTLTELMKGIGDVIMAAADVVVNVGTKLAEGAVNILDIIMQGLGKAAKSLPTIMGALGEAVVAFFTPMQALVNPMIIAGIAIFTGAMIGLGFAFKLLGEGIGAAAPGIQAFFDGVGTVITAVGNAIATVIESITTSVIRLQDIDGSRLLLTAGGITAVAMSLAAFGGGGILAGIGGAIGDFFGGDPVEKFKAFESINADKLNAVAEAITAMGLAIRSFTDALSSVGDTSPIIDTIDKVMDLHDELSESAGEKILNGVTDAVEGVFSAATDWVASMPGLESVFGGGDEASSSAGGKKEATLTEVSGLLKELIAKVDQPVKINIGGRVLDELESQASMRRSYNTKLDGAYGANG